MAVLPDYRLDSLGALETGLFIIGVAVLFIFASTLTTVVVGAVVLGVALLVIYYTAVRIDAWARGAGGDY